MIHVYCGDGKGKTTAALGLLMRAAGAGKKVLFTQFMKGGKTAELAVLDKMPEVTIIRSKKRFPFYGSMSQKEKNELAKIHNNILDVILEKINTGECGMLILDEITYPYDWELLDKEKLNEIFSKGKEIEIVCTGRNPADFFWERADYITEMKCIRHPYEKGIAAREGIEF